VVGYGQSGGFEFPLHLTRVITTSRETAASTPQQRAIQLYPDLAKSDSALNREFLRRVKAYQQDNTDFFKNPEWPTVLAKESKVQWMAAARQTK